MNEQDRFVREPEVARVTGLSCTTRWRLERAGKFPRRRCISANAVAWLESEIHTWMDERAIAGTTPGSAVELHARSFA